MLLIFDLQYLNTILRNILSFAIIRKTLFEDDNGSNNPVLVLQISLSNDYLANGIRVFTLFSITIHNTSIETSTTRSVSICDAFCTILDWSLDLLHFQGIITAQFYQS